MSILDKELFDANGYFTGYHTRVHKDWIDYNNHMNVAFYVLAFDKASDAFLKQTGMDENYVVEQKKSAFVVDMNVTYRQELVLDAPISFATQLLKVTEKKMQIYHYMYHAEEGFLAATNEILAVHVDMEERKSSVFPDDIRKNLEILSDFQKDIPLPKNSGRIISA